MGLPTQLVMVFRSPRYASWHCDVQDHSHKNFERTLWNLLRFRWSTICKDGSIKLLMSFLKRQSLQLSIPALALALTAAATADQHGHDEKSKNHMTMSEQHPLMAVEQLIAVVTPANDSNVQGTVTFTRVANGVEVVAKIGGLGANTKHGFHVHEFGNIVADDGTSAGGHYDNEGHAHGLPGAAERHAGDFGNLESDGDGNAVLKFTVDNITLAGDKNPIVGRAVVVHAKEDDGGQPTGNAGDRIGVGVIGISTVSKALPEVPEEEPMPK